MKKWRLTAAGMCVALLLAGCADKKPEEPVQTENEVQEKTEEELREEAKQAKLEQISPAAYDNVEGLDLEPGTYFSLIGRSGTKEYWKTVKAGAEAAVEDINAALGYEGSDKVKIVYNAPSESDDVGEQVNILDEELARYPACLGISIIDTQSCSVQFDLATQNGIPIVLFDSMSDYQGVMAKVGTNNLAAAKEAATHMAEALGDKGEIIILANDNRSTSGMQRIKGFKEELEANHPEMHIAGTYYMETLDDVKKEMIEGTDEESVEGEEAAESTEQEMLDEEEMTEIESITDEEAYDYILAKHPEAKGIYTSNGPCAIAMADALDRAEKMGVKIIAFDADTDEMEALKDGRIYGTMLQNPYGIGYATIIAQARSVLELGNEAEIDTGYVWVTAENYQDEEMQKLLYEL